MDDVDTFRASVGSGLSSFGETLTVSLEAGTLKIQSICVFPQLFDWGKNKRNVRLFLNHFVPAETRNQKLERTPAFLDETGSTPLERVFAETPITGEMELTNDTLPFDPTFRK